MSSGSLARSLSALASGTARLLDLALPARCAGCGLEGEPICGHCLPALHARQDLPPGVPLGLAADLPAPLLQLEWCAPFSGTVRRALHQLKYAGEQRLAVPLGQAIAQRWARAGAGGDLLVHVPVHAERARTRGYDQAQVLATAAARAMDRPAASLLERRRATVAQFELDRSERAANVSGAFGLSRAGAAFAARGQLQGRWIVLVDDVVTTGSTLAACAEVLMETGALGVSAVTVARER